MKTFDHEKLRVYQDAIKLDSSDETAVGKELLFGIESMFARLSVK